VLLPSVLIAILVFVVDQLSKLVVLQNVKIGEMVPIMPFINFTRSHNYGAAFGILGDGESLQRWLFIGVAVIITLAVLLWSSRLEKGDKWNTAALGLIMGGAWGNLLDRLMHGRVTDFIDFYSGSWHWYTFNIADIAICAGAAILVAMSFKKA